MPLLACMRSSWNRRLIARIPAGPALTGMMICASPQHGPSFATVMDIPIEHRPHGIACREPVALRFLRFFDCSSDHRSWIAADTNWYHPYGSISTAPSEVDANVKYGRLSVEPLAEAPGSFTPPRPPGSPAPVTFLESHFLSPTIL